MDIPYTIDVGAILAEGDTVTIGTLDRPGRLGAFPYEVHVTGPHMLPIYWRVIKTRQLTSVEWRFADGVEGKAHADPDPPTRPVVIGRIVTKDMRSDLLYIGDEVDHG